MTAMDYGGPCWVGVRPVLKTCLFSLPHKQVSLLRGRRPPVLLIGASLFTDKTEKGLHQLSALVHRSRLPSPCALHLTVHLTLC